MRVPLIPDREITLAEALALAATQWWVGQPARDVALAQLRQPLLCMPFGQFQTVCEQATGQTLSTIAFTNPQGIIAMIERRR